MATWQALGWDDVLRRAWMQGTVIAAMCAGAMAMFQHYACKWHRVPRLAEGIGLLPGSFGCHFDEHDNPSHNLYRTAIADGVIPGGYALEDGFALRFAGTELVECVRSRPGARGWALSADGAGGVVERELHGDLLADRVELAALPGTSRDDIPAIVEGLSSLDALSGHSER